MPPSALPPISPWQRSRGKRVFDLVCTVPLIVLSLPVMVVMAVALKLTTPGPVFFRQRRCGRDGCEFELLKFRTMRADHTTIGPGITRAGDPRITALGRLLRRWKLDELPQLFNVLRGDMSLVGPRPDLPAYLARLPRHQRIVLALTPGVTGPATVRLRNEEDVLAKVRPDELEAFYVHTLLPQKIALELEYARAGSLAGDAALLLRTAAAILGRTRANQ